MARQLALLGQQKKELESLRQSDIHRYYMHRERERKRKLEKDNKHTEIDSKIDKDIYIYIFVANEQTEIDNIDWYV